MSRAHQARLLDVAAAAGVSLAAASRALSGSPGVSERVAAHVRAVAADIGYIPNAHARALAGGAPEVVGLIVHDVGDPYFAEIARGVLRATERRGLMALICQTQRDPAAELDRIRSLRANRVGAIVLAGSGYSDATLVKTTVRELASFTSAGGRIAVIGRHHLPVDAVLPDNRAAGVTLMNHLLDLGHRKIGLVSGPVILTTVEDRTAGVLAAAQSAGIDPDSLPVEYGDFTRDGGAAASARLMARAPEITALVALNDAMAIGSLAAADAAGIEVPRRLSIVGFDDIPTAADVRPTLTTVRLPMAEMGERALEMALSEPSTRPRRRRTGHALVVRDSSGPPRPASTKLQTNRKRARAG